MSERQAPIIGESASVGYTPHVQRFVASALSQRQVLIIGDSISVGYTPRVQELVADRNVAIENVVGGDSSQLLAGLPGWVQGRKLDLIQLNCGLHDLRIRLDHPCFYYQQPIDHYETNLSRIVAWLQSHVPTETRLVWASTTPVLTQRIPTRNNVRTMADVHAYNAVARSIMEAAGIPILDLCAVVLADTVSECITEDGVHMTERGNALLAQAVAASIVAIIP